MNAQDFTTSITVNETADQVFAAINDPRNWWFGEIDGSSEKIDDEFSYRVPNAHFSVQKVVELLPNKKVVWLITESKLDFLQDKDEWTGTQVIFNIQDEDGKTKMTLTHQGLTPKVECFNACSNGWTQIIQKSLKSLITTGKGIRIF